MKLRKCGNSDLLLSELGTGCWEFGGGDYWGNQDQNDVNDVVRRSFELGINVFDTAEMYNEGRSEEALGKALLGIPRDRIHVISKISPSNCYPDTLVEHCEASLKRLGTDCIDVYMIHWPVHPHSIRHFTKDEAIINNPPDVAEAFEAMVRLKDMGKIRYIGVSNFGVKRLEEAMEHCKTIVVNELPYSLLTRAIEYDVLPFCQNHHVGIIGYMTMLQGILTDLYPTLNDVPSWQRRTRHFNSKHNNLARHGEEGFEEETNETLNAIRTILKGCGLTMPEVAIQWAIANKAVTSVLVGARNTKELEANVKAVENPLPDDTVEKLNRATKRLMEKMGPGFDYYESKKNDRT